MLIAGTTQDRMGLPLTNTVQVPQTPIPQLYFVPVMSSRSLRAHKRGISDGASTVWACPLIFKLTWLILIPKIATQRGYQITPSPGMIE
jgi:hypothetical protein